MESKKRNEYGRANKGVYLSDNDSMNVEQPNKQLVE